MTTSAEITHEAIRAGTVIGLWRYPVKSMLGERLSALEVEARGVVGDRLYAVRDEDGKFGSGKSTRRFRQMAGLLTLRARYRDAVPTVQLPDGRTFLGGDPALDARLTEMIGRPVTIAREAAISHLDDGPIHLVTTASLRTIGEALQTGPADARRFRPNLVIDSNGEGFEENSWIGRELQVGSEVRLRVTGRAIRCVMIGFAQEELAADPTMLKRVGEANDAHFGVYCDVLTPGILHLDDQVWLV